jgi:hypothetical protein
MKADEATKYPQKGTAVGRFVLQSITFRMTNSISTMPSTKNSPLLRLAKLIILKHFWLCILTVKYRDVIDASLKALQSLLRKNINKEVIDVRYLYNHTKK